MISSVFGNFNITDINLQSKGDLEKEEVSEERVKLPSYMKLWKILEN